MIPNAITSSATTQSPASTVQFHNKEEREDNLSLVFGIASLILEGRPIGDEYQITSESLNKEDENSHLPKFESYNNIFAEANSVFPSTSKILKNVSRSNALNTTAQKLYQLRQKALVTSIDTSVGRKATSTISNSSAYSTHSRNIGFYQEDDDINATPNLCADESGCLYSLQSLATTCLQSGSSSTRPCTIFYDAAQSSFKNDEEKPDFPKDRTWTPTTNVDMKKFLIGPMCDNKLNPSNLNQCLPSTMSTNALFGKKKKSYQRMPSPTQLQQGPHCDQFLKKIGLGKGESFEADEHYCDMSYLNITCSRWKAYCLKIEAIIKRGLPVCIEVYLGPVSHKILLEQWIVAINERAITPTMTLPSLCSAIRSQLYFSQISSWCDLIKKCEKSVEETGRVVFGMTNNAAGDLIQTPHQNLSTTFGSSSSNSIPKIATPIKRRPRLNIFYRIRHYDSTNCFNSKPRMHNFPNVNVSENFSISVCLKSLPRLSGGIPKVGQFLTNSNENTSPQIFPEKKDNYCANSSSFKNCGFDKISTPKEYTTTKICDTNISKPTSTTECFINLMSDVFSSFHQNSNVDNNMFLSTKQSDFDSKTESECSNSLDGLSHREKQLLKYRKRMLKRDKQLRSCFKNTSICYPQYTKPLNNFLSNNNQKNWASIDRDVPHNNMKQESTSVTKVSIGTQTQYASCKQCGNEKSFVCLTCHHSENNLCIDEDELSSMNNYKKSVIIQKPCNKADLLLQAIQRTPQTARLKKKCSSADQVLSSISTKPPQNNNTNLTSTATSNSKNSCGVCKRQKTQHIYNNQRENEEDKIQDQDFSNNTNYEKKNFEQHTHSKIFNNETAPSTATNQKSNINLETEFQRAEFKTPTEEDQNGKSADRPIQSLSEFLGNLREIPNEQIMKNVSMAQQKNNTDIQTVTPTNISNNSKTLRKCLPKINLTPIFCKAQNSMGEQYWKSIKYPVSIDPKELSSPNKTYSRIENFVTIQKSNSAPTLPNSLELSPRFAKQTTSTSKPRSRHFSDRSDRSSFCSDEPFSDEEFENSLCSPADSPNKNNKSYLINFRRLPLLGNLEESLLQKRLVPKMEVVGFKVLLGASGGFCPTQLTIPASAYFYELHGVDISTPYICEIQLPRKGYVVPRSGTVQVTLLNPTGTVVRMFVVPYDMRDMPPLHCTFVRQRILAEENTKNLKSLSDTIINNKNSFDNANKSANDNSKKTNETSEKQFGHFISPEHMKRLRYCIHLKFQTSRSGRLLLHTDIRLLISRRTDCDTAIAHAKGAGLESSNDLVIHTFMPGNPTYSTRQENSTKL